jgi:hypothetical protein
MTRSGNWGQRGKQRTDFCDNLCKEWETTKKEQSHKNEWEVKKKQKSHGGNEK